MAIKFTQQQQKVIDLHGRNILVSAAAGSGKTAVLVERIIQMICREEEPVDIDRLLIVTFTNAAAAEMRERISLGINRQMALHPESEHIQRQAALLHNAQITTIDSFCMFLLRNHFHQVGVDPAFRVMDEGERKLMEQDVLAQLLEDSFAAGEEAFLHCVEYFCPAGRESVLEEYILALYHTAESYPWPHEWLAERREDYKVQTEEALETTEYGVYLKNHLQKVLTGCLGTYGRLQQLCQEPDGPYMYGALVDKELEQLEKLLECDSLAAYSARIPAMVFDRLPAKKDDTVSAEKRELAKELRNQIKDIVKDLAQRFFATPLLLAVSQGNQCEQPVKVLIDLVLEFQKRLQEKKQEAKLVDFSDMEHYALQILTQKDGDQIRPSQTAREYRTYFAEVLIDEYQDSNLVQECLLKAVSGEEDGNYNRFMVGDVKQSIYKFRLARPELFLEKYDTYSLEDGICQRIDLSSNFRSRREVVDAVNGIFGAVMSRQTGGITYDESARLYVGATYFPENTGCESELLLVEDAAGGEEAKESEAAMIADRIRELMGSFQVTDKETGALRPVSYRDMVILLRSPKGWDETLKEVLEQEGIPVYVTSKTGYFAVPEVQELLQLLRVLDNPRQDIPLFGVMKSIFGGFSEEEIALLRSGKKNGTLYEALQDAAQMTASAASTKAVKEQLLQKKVCAFLDRINRYRSYTAYMPTRELLQELINENQYLAYVTALPMGSKRRANVEMLLTKASDFEKTSYHGLFHFIRYIEQLEKYDVDYGEADLLDENADVVRIMSIHKSKGLEFSVTFVSGMAKRFNMQDANKALIIDTDMGIGVDYVDVERRIRNKTLRRAVLARKMREDNLAEELRILYVALTRAKEKLIMTASVKDALKKAEKYAAQNKEQLLYHDFMECNSYLDFVLPVASCAGITVSCMDAVSLYDGREKEQVVLWDKKERLKSAKEHADPVTYEWLKEVFRFRYPYAALENLYTKTTVSELKIAAMADKDEAAYHAFEEQEVVPYIPKFKRGQEKISGAVRGDAFHKVMEIMEFKEMYQGLWENVPQSPDAFRNGVYNAAEQLLGNLQQFLDKMVQSGRLSMEYRQAVNDGKLVHFLQNEIGYRMYRACLNGTLHREQPFVYGISAERLGKEFSAEEKVMIQGIIDAYFVEDGKIVLLDYKTDVVTSGEELWNRYETQVQYYEEALQSLSGLEVKQKILYSFYLEKCVEE